MKLVKFVSFEMAIGCLKIAKFFVRRGHRSTCFFFVGIGDWLMDTFNGSAPSDL